MGMTVYAGLPRALKRMGEVSEGGKVRRVRGVMCAGYPGMRKGRLKEWGGVASFTPGALFNGISPNLRGQTFVVIGVCDIRRLYYRAARVTPLPLQKASKRPFKINIF